jgi:hypothetical protein
MSFRLLSLYCLRKRAATTYPELCGIQLLLDGVRKVVASNSDKS